MSYDQTLAERIRKVLKLRSGVTEKKMFGGLAFLLDGSMFCGIVKDELMVRVGPAHYDEALAEPHVRPMDFTGRPAKGYVFVGPPGLGSDSALEMWISRGADFVSGLPAKTALQRRRRQP